MPTLKTTTKVVVFQFYIPNYAWNSPLDCSYGVTILDLPRKIGNANTRVKRKLGSFFMLGSDPVAVPGILVGDGAPSSSADRCHSLSSLYLPLAALASFPTYGVTILGLPRKIGNANTKPHYFGSEAFYALTNG